MSSSGRSTDRPSRRRLLAGRGAGRWSAAGDGDLGPGAQVDAVAGAQGDGVTGGNVLAVDGDAVFRAQVDDGPAAVGGGEELGVQPGDAGVAGRADEVDLRLDAAGDAAAADADLRAGERDAPFWLLAGEADLRGV